MKFPYKFLSKTLTEYLFLINVSTKIDPIYPKPPITRIFSLISFLII